MTVAAPSKSAPATHALAAAAPQGPVLQAGSSNVLTVGAGMEFSTLSDALKAAVAGQTIAVQAGTYLNDFGVVNAAVHIIAVGGIVNEVANVPPPNDKGLLTINADTTIQGFTFTGGSDGGWDGNVAGIRLQAGSLNVSYCYFHDMQEGLLAGPDATASVTIDHSEFSHNGTGDGYTHNLYVGAVGTLTVTNSYFHDAVVGHEIKSRAATTNILNNVIADGPTGTASYDIDIPNAGVATVRGNLIEKGPMAQNREAIHYGGETQYSYASNALSVTGNTIINDYGPLASVVINDDAVNGLTTPASIANNVLYGFDPAMALIGPGTLTNNTVPATRPSYAAPATWANDPVASIAAGPQLLNLINGGHAIGGGAAHLTINDSFGSNAITGGRGGITANISGGFDQISTQAGATDQVTLTGRNAVLHSAGADHISAAGAYNEVDATGPATITGAGFDTYNLAGADQLTSTSGENVNVAATGVVRLTDTAGDVGLTVAAGGHITIDDEAATPQGGAASGATVTGAATGWIGNNGALSLTTGATGGAVQAGAGQVSVTGGAGADIFTAGSGYDSFSLGGGADTVTFGAGHATVAGGTGADIYHFRAGADGHDTIGGFKPGTDVLKFDGFTGNAVASGVVAGGNTLLTLTDGTTIQFTGVSLPDYGGSTPPSGGGGTAPTPAPIAPPPPGGSPGSGGSGTSGSGTIVLTSAGHDLVGGAAALTVNDTAGGNTIAGGAGGLTANAGWSDLITTQAGATDQIILSRNDTLTGAGADQVTATNTGDVITEQGTAHVTLLNAGSSVQGGAGLLTVTDIAGGDTVLGGAGGVAASLAGCYNAVTTEAGASDTISVAGQSTVTSAGVDSISVQGGYNHVTVTGAATIASSSGFSSFDLEGAETLTLAGGVVNVGGQASATVSASGQGDVYLTKQAGGSLLASLTLPTGTSTLGLSGGAAQLFACTDGAGYLAATVGGGINVLAGTGPSVLVSQTEAGGRADTIHGGSGALLLTSGAAGIDLLAGSGNVTLNGGTGDSITLGAGAVTVQGGTAEHFLVAAGATGTLVVDNWTAQDTLQTANGALGVGSSDHDLVSQVVVNGSTWLHLAGGAQVELVGVGHFG